MPQLNENQSFRRTAGSFSRKQLTTRALKAMLGVGAAMGVVFAIILDFVLSFWVDDGLLIWIELLIAALLMTIISLVYEFFHSLESRQLEKRAIWGNSRGSNN